jgi:hypothetical protein
MKFNFDWRILDKWKWNVHWKTCGERKNWKCANKKSRVEENGEQIMKKNLQNYMFKEIFGEGIT